MYDIVCIFGLVLRAIIYCTNLKDGLYREDIGKLQLRRIAKICFYTFDRSPFHSILGTDPKRFGDIFEKRRQAGFSHLPCLSLLRYFDAEGPRAGMNRGIEDRHISASGFLEAYVISASKDVIRRKNTICIRAFFEIELCAERG